MKYFKHESSALFNKKIRKLKRDFGAEGYGIYFQIIELIAEDIEKNTYKNWGFLPDDYWRDKEYLADEISTDITKLNNVIDLCFEIGLFEKRDERLYCQRVIDSADEYTQKLMRTNEAKNEKLEGQSTDSDVQNTEETDSIGTISGQSTDTITTLSGIRKEEEKEKNKTKDKSFGENSPNDEDIGENEQEHGNSEINDILNTFKEHFQRIPSDKYPRRVAQNIRQIVNSFVKRRRDMFHSLREEELLPEYVFEKFYANLETKEYYNSIEKLETVKLKLKVYLDEIETNLEKEFKRYELEKEVLNASG